MVSDKSPWTSYVFGYQAHIERTVHLVRLFVTFHRDSVHFIRAQFAAVPQLHIDQKCDDVGVP
jgi:hypothetical protein